MALSQELTDEENLGKLIFFDKKLSVRNNLLSGRFDDLNIPGAGNLDRLNLANNQFSGPLPDELARRTNLVDLILNDNSFTGPIPTSYGNLRKLESLIIQDNDVTGRVPEEICGLRELGNLTKLETLTVDCTSEVTCNCCTDCY